MALISIILPPRAFNNKQICYDYLLFHHFRFSVRFSMLAWVGRFPLIKLIHSFRSCVHSAMRPRDCRSCNPIISASRHPIISALSFKVSIPIRLRTKNYELSKNFHRSFGAGFFYNQMPFDVNRLLNLCKVDQLLKLKLSGAISYRTMSLPGVTHFDS